MKAIIIQFNNKTLKYIKYIVSKLSPRTQNFLRRMKGFLLPLELCKSRKVITKNFANFDSNILPNKNDLTIWEKAFRRYMKTNPQNREIVTSFTNCQIYPIKVNIKNQQTDSVTLICVVKNDLERIKMLYKHYRKIGVQHFVMVDNNSDDGTREWLSEQPDTDLYIVKEKFFSLRKYGWINRIISMYGFKRWYLYVDSDELFVYENMENRTISDLISYCKKNGLIRMSVIMLDMYSDKGVFKTTSNNKSIKDEYIYFDSDSYLVKKNYKGLLIRGGPRKRVMSNDNTWEGPVLIKHPLFFFQKGDIFESAHYIFPFEHKTFVSGALLHYKFLETDFKRYKKIATEENFAGGSKEYKQYIESYESNGRLTFMYEGSIKFINSSSLRNISFIEEIKW